MAKPLKVAILGTAPSWHDAPFNEKDWQIWVANRAGLKQTPWDKLFEIHHNWDYEDPTRSRDYLNQLDRVKPPQEIITIDDRLKGSAVTIIDRDELVREFRGAIWFSSTFSYMIGHAIMLGAAEISLWGVDLESREEYVTQFAGTRHMLAIAEERGIKVNIQDRALVLRDPDPYPDRFETALAYKLEHMCADLDKKVNICFHRMNDAREAYAVSRYDVDKDFTAEYSTRQRLEDCIEVWGRVKGALWCAQHIRRLFVFNVLDPDPGDELMFDAEDSGPT